MAESSVPTAAAVLAEHLNQCGAGYWSLIDGENETTALRAALPGSPVRILIDCSSNPEGELSAAPTYEAVRCVRCAGRGTEQRSRYSDGATLSEPCSMCGGSGSLYRRLEGGTT